MITAKWQSLSRVGPESLSVRSFVRLPLSRAHERSERAEAGSARFGLGRGTFTRTPAHAASWLRYSSRGPALRRALARSLARQPFFQGYIQGVAARRAALPLYLQHLMPATPRDV